MTYNPNNQVNLGSSDQQADGGGQLNTSVLSRALNSHYVRNKVDQIKQDDDLVNENNLKMSDRRRSNILDIAEFLESELKSEGYELMVSEISRIITRIFERMGLEKYSYLILEVLPDKYKDKNRDAYKNLQSRLAANKIKRHISEIRSIDRKLLDPPTLRELKSILLEIPDDYDRELLVRKEPLYIEYGSQSNHHNELDALKETEENRFKKASIGLPLSTVEKLCQDPEYAALYPSLVKTCDQMVRGMEIMRDWFTVEYPPLNVPDLKDLTHGFGMWNEYWRPHYDKKYRRDHTQLIRIAYTRAKHTSTKASHESQIACAHYLDKNGLPVMRGMTKEQIDSMSEWEINFNQELINTLIAWGPLVSRVNASHGGRAKEDRAVALSAHLSHHA